MLKDEIYCHLVKQTTNNRSDRGDSCGRGWRLMVIITAFHRPSDYFEKFLRAYLQVQTLPAHPLVPLPRILVALLS